MDLKEQLVSAKKWLLGIRNRDEAEEGIKKSQLWQQSLATWSKRLGKTAIAVGTVGLLSRSLGILTVAAVVGGAYGAVKLASYILDKNIELKRAAEAEMTADTNGPKPSNSLKPAGPGLNMKAKVSGGFNATAEKPANDDAAADTNPAKKLLSRFGIKI